MISHHPRSALALACCGLCLMPSGMAQEMRIEPIRPQAPILWRPYSPAQVPPARMSNSARLRELVRAGRLYLTVADAIALALENNIDLEVARYNPLASDWRVERAQAGGTLPGVPSGASQSGSVAAGQGVVGSQNAAGVNVNGGANGATATGNATVSQIGPITQNLDPSIQDTTTFTHKTTPEPNVVQSVTPVLISNTRVSTAAYQQGFLSGGAVSVTFSEHYLNENSPTDVLNPSVAPNLSIGFQHNLLRGLGVAVNGRTITVAKINRQISDLNFEAQVSSTVADVVNAYYGLVADNEDVQAKKIALESAQTFFHDNHRRVELGSLAEVDLATSEGQAATAKQNLVVSETTAKQQELRLKSLISRNGLGDPLVASAQIVTLDRMIIPAQDNLPSLKEMIDRAAKRPDLAAQKASVTTAEISGLGTQNGVRPALVAFGAESHAGLAGSPKIVQGPNGPDTANAYFVGGLGTGLGQIFRRDFATDRAGAFFQAPIGNRQATADQAIDLLQLRQTQLTTQKALNQAGVDVLNAVIALRQARVRYEAAVQNRKLTEELLGAEQKKFSLGASTPYEVVQQQRDLIGAQSSEISALASYNNARVALDQTMGTTLENNHVILGEAKNGRIERSSALPATAPGQP